jgi:hypothetical protein
MQFRLRTLLIVLAVGLAVILILFCVVYVGLWFVVGSPSQFFERIVMSREALLREQAASAIGPRGYFLSSEPVVLNRPAPDRAELSGKCVDSNGQGYTFKAEFSRVGDEYECIRVAIDNE